MQRQAHPGAGKEKPRAILRGRIASLPCAAGAFNGLAMCCLSAFQAPGHGNIGADISAAGGTG